MAEPAKGLADAHRGPRRRRASKRTLRVLAWGAGIASFALPWAALGASPKPVAASAAPPPKPKVIVRHRTITHVIWSDAPTTASKPQIKYVYVAGATSGGGTAPTATSSGSHP